MKRNKLLTLLVLVALLSLAVLATACEQVYDQKVTTSEYLASPATCTSPAKYYYSSKRGDKGTETFTDGSPLAHTFTVLVEISTPPTVTEDGVATFKCANCDATDTAVVVPKLSDTSVWGATPNPAPTHTADGKTDYTSPVYGTITVVAPKLGDNHVFDQKVVSADHLASAATCTAGAKYYYSCACGANGTETFSDDKSLDHAFTTFVEITTDPTVDADGVATFKCFNCDATDTAVVVPKLSDSTVWTATPNPAATHLTEGTMEYTSANYPDVKLTSTIDKLSKHTFDKQIAESKYLVNGATYTSGATYYYSCECGEHGTETFTVGEPLAAPYLGKTYNGFSGGYNGFVGIKEACSLVVTKDGTADNTLNDNGGTFTLSMLDNNGKVKVVLNIEDNEPAEYYGYVSLDGNYFVIINKDTSSEKFGNVYYILTTVENADFWAQRFGSIRLNAITSNEVEQIFCMDDYTLTFGLSLVDFNGNEISSENIATADYFAIKQGDNKLYAYYKQGKEFLSTDGIEGIYVNDGTTLTLDGHGGAVIGSGSAAEVGTYKRVADGADYDIDVTTANLYWQVTLDGSSFTKFAPVVTITFNANGGVPGSITVNANVNVPCTLLTVTRSGFKFIGWYSDEGLTQLVQDPFVPTKDVTLYAKWSSAVTIVFENLVDGASTSHKQYLEELVLANAPAYTATTKNGNKLFRGWYVGEVDEPTFIDENRALTAEDVESGTIVVKAYWVDVATLTVVYGNGIKDTVVEYAVGDELVLDEFVPAYTNGKLFDGWYANEGCTESFVADSITENTTIYAKWQESVVPFVGTYENAVYFSLGSSSYDDESISFVNSSTTIATDGTVSGYIGGTITSFNATTGKFVMSGNECMYDAEHGIIVFVSGKTYKVLFVNATASAYGSKSDNVRFWNYGKAILTRVALTGGELDNVMLFVHNGELYVDVHATYTYNGKTNVVDDIANMNGLPDALTVYDVNNNVIATLKRNGYNLYDFDNLNGTYTGDRGEVVLDGFGGITVGGASATYTIVGNGVIGYILNNEYVELTLGDGTYTSAVPTVDVKFNTGSVGASGLTFVESYNKNVEHALTDLDVADGYIFIGWYLTADFSGDAVTSIVPTEVTTLYAMVVKGVTLSYVTERGIAPQSKTVLAGTVVELPRLENITGWAFVGWYVSGDETQTIITEITVDNDVELVAKWQVALKLTLVYGNTLDSEEKWYSDTETFDVAEFAPEQKFVNGKVFAGWCSDEACEIAFTATSISENTTIWAKWVDPHPMYGEYGYGANLDPSESGIVKETDTLSSTTTSYRFVVDAYGNITIGVTSSVAEFDAITGVFKTANNYYGGFNAVANVMYTEFGANKTSAYHDIKFAVGAIGDVYPTNTYNNAWDKGITKFVRITYSDNSVRYILIKDRVVYAVAADGWTATDANGNDVTFDNVYSNAQTLIISGAQNDGTIVTFKLGRSNNNFVELDGFEGTYTLEGGANLVLDGAGGAKLVWETTVSGTYAAIDGGIELYMNSNTEYYTAVLDVEAKTYTITKPTVEITFVTDHGTLAETTVHANINIKYTLPAAPTIEDDAYKFRGWYLQGDETQKLVTSIVPTANAIYVAKWDAKVTVRVNYNKESLGSTTRTFYVGDKQDIALPTDIIDNQYAASWFTTADFAEGTEWTIGSAAQTNIEIWCKWADAHAMSGTFKGFEVYSIVSGATKYATTEVLVLKPDGKFTGVRSISGELSADDFNITNGNITNSIGRYAYISDVFGGIVLIPYGTSTSTFSNDFYIGFRNYANITSIDCSGNTFNKIYAAWLTVNYTDGETAKTLNLFIYNDQLYTNVTWLSDGEAISAKNCAGTKNVVIYDSNNNGIIKKSGDAFVGNDGLGGTYVCDGNDDLILDGYGCGTVGANTTVAYTVLENGNVYYVLNNKQHVVALGEGTYTVELDGMQGTWTLPDNAGTIALDGYGSAGDGRTYVVSGTTLTVYDGENSTSYGIGDNFTLLGKSVFAGLTFTKSSTIYITFADGVDISGKMVCGYSSWYFEFDNGSVVGNELTVTVTKQSGTGASGNIVFTISGNKLILKSGNLPYVSSYVPVGTELICEGFSL